MHEADAGQPRTIWTVGHSNHPLDRFLALLREHEIEVVADVRSQPYSRYTPHFTRDALRASLTDAGLHYLFMGEQLGGRPDPSLAGLYDEEGHVRYDALSETASFRAGIARVLDGIGRYRVAIMCSEDDPIHCHRRLLVGRVLAGEYGLATVHIRGSGAVESEREVERRDMPSAGQLGMFDDEEVRAWRSVRSVLRRDPPPPSSGR